MSNNGRPWPTPLAPAGRTLAMARTRTQAGVPLWMTRPMPIRVETLSMDVEGNVVRDTAVFVVSNDD